MNDLVTLLLGPNRTRAGAVILVVSLVALTSVWRSSRHSAKSKWLWTAIVMCLPVLGAIAWFLLARGTRRPDAGAR
jgi:bacteriorhodopsin